MDLPDNESTNKRTNEKAISLMFLCGKRRNIRKKSDKNLQKRRFPAYFWHFRPEKNLFAKILKIGLRHILGIDILHLYAKNQKKTNEPFTKLVTDERTKEQTNERTNERTDEQTWVNL